MKNIGIKILSILYWILFFFLSTFFCSLIFVVRLLTFPFDRRVYLTNIVSLPWGYFAIRINPLWKLTVEGREKIKWGKPYVVVANHQSHFDIMVLYCLLRPFKYLAKDSLLKIPFIGWGMLINKYVIVKREDRKSRGKALLKCRDWLKKDISILIFPEGTRSKDGHLKDFKYGAFRMAIEEKVPLIPVVIKGTFDILPKHSFVLNGRAQIHIKVLDPIPTDHLIPEKSVEFTKEVQEIMRQEFESSSEMPTLKYSASS